MHQLLEDKSITSNEMSSSVDKDVAKRDKDVAKPGRRCRKAKRECSIMRR